MFKIKCLEAKNGTLAILFGSYSRGLVHTEIKEKY